MVLGCVSPVGDQGADIAKTAAIKAGLPDTVAGVQLNRFCASGLEAVNIAAQKVASGWEDLVFAGGVESMSRVPMGSDGGDGARRFLVDHAGEPEHAGNCRSTIGFPHIQGHRIVMQPTRAAQPGRFS